MKIQMLETHRGSEDNFGVKLFEAGKNYDVSHSLATQFVSRGWATEVMTSYVNCGMSCQAVGEAS